MSDEYSLFEQACATVERMRYIAVPPQVTRERVLDSKKFIEGLRARVRESPESITAARAEVETIAHHIHTPEYRKEWSSLAAGLDRGESIYALFNVVQVLTRMRMIDAQPIPVRITKTGGGFLPRYLVDTGYTAWEDTFRRISTLGRRMDVFLLTDSEAQMRKNSPFTKPVRDPQFGVECILDSKHFAALERLVEQQYDEGLADAVLLRRRANSVFHLYLESGSELVMKQYGRDNADRLERDYFFLNALASEGRAPSPRRIPGAILMPYVGRESLLNSTRSLEELYDGALEIIVALDDLARVQRNTPLVKGLPIIDESYFKKKYGFIPADASHRLTLISPSLFHGHYLVDERDGIVKRIDFEKTYVGPAELALVNLFLGSMNSLDDEFIEQRLQTYFGLLDKRGIRIDERSCREGFETLYVSLVSKARSAREHAREVNA